MQYRIAHHHLEKNMTGPTARVTVKFHQPVPRKLSREDGLPRPVKAPTKTRATTSPSSSPPKLHAVPSVRTSKGKPSADDIAPPVMNFLEEIAYRNFGKRTVTLSELRARFPNDKTPAGITKTSMAPTPATRDTPPAAPRSPVKQPPSSSPRKAEVVVRPTGGKGVPKSVAPTTPAAAHPLKSKPAVSSGRTREVVRASQHDKTSGSPRSKSDIPVRPKRGPSHPGDGRVSGDKTSDTKADRALLASPRKLGDTPRRKVSVERKNPDPTPRIEASASEKTKATQPLAQTPAHAMLSPLTFNGRLPLHPQPPSRLVPTPKRTPPQQRAVQPVGRSTKPGVPVQDEGKAATPRERREVRELDLRPRKAVGTPRAPKVGNRKMKKIDI